MEMALDGWRFLVLSPAFAIHWGFQEKNQQSKIRKMQVNKNRRRFNEFEKEVRAKYEVRNGKSSIFGHNGKRKHGIKSKPSNIHKIKVKSKKKEVNVNRIETKAITKHSLVMQTPKFHPVTYKPLFYEYDMAGPKIGDSIIE
jgi:hypothetical protein